MARYTNSSIVPAALRGEDAETANGNMSTVRIDAPCFARWTGNMPKAWARIFTERVTAGMVSQAIYSYSTPIAWHDSEHGWIIPLVTYSATTSSKHQSQLHAGWHRPGLPDARRVYLPWDATIEEARRVLDGRMHFVTDRQGRATGTVPGPNYVAGE